MLKVCVAPTAKEADVMPTGMDSFNQLRQAFLDERDDLGPWLDAYLAEFGASHRVFYSELRYQEDSPELQQHAPVALEALNRLQHYNEGLRLALAENNREAAEELFHRCARCLARLHDAYRELRALPREELSPSPFISELLRCGRLYLDGKLSAELLRERLESQMLHFQSFLAQFETTQPEAREQAVWNQRQSGLESGFDTFTAACFELDVQLEQAEPDLERVAGLLGDIRQATAAIYEVQQALQAASEAGDHRNCHRCGARNGLSARYCTACQTALPVFSTEEAVSGPQVSLRMEEEGMQAAEGLPPYLAAFLRAIEETAEGLRGADDLRADFERQQNRVRQLERGLQDLKPPGGDTTPEQQRFFTEMQADLSRCLGEYAEGLGWVEDFFESNDSQLLWQALKVLEPAAQNLAEVQSRGLSWILQAQAS